MSAPTGKITEPGVYPLTAYRYHRDPVADGSLTSTGARRLLPPGCPALFDHERRNGRPNKQVFDFGRAAHTRALGVGDPITVVAGSGKDPNAWTTNETKQAVAEARAAGLTPVKPEEAEQVERMAAALAAHPDAARLLDHRDGKPEQALVWRDEETGVWCRAMLDWLPQAWPGEPLRVADYKTTGSAEPSAIARHCADYGYTQQAAWYLDGVRALDLGGGAGAEFHFIFQEKTAPYLVTVATLNEEALAAGRIRNRKARDLYRRCAAAGHWPGYTDGPITVGLPAWELSRFNAAWQDGAYDIDSDLDSQEGAA